MKLIIFFFVLSAANGILIRCYFRDLVWNLLDLAFTCQVTSMNFSDNSTHITGYSGTNLPGLSSADVKMISFHSNDCPRLNLTFVPKGFSNFFPNVLGILFSSCSIHTLQGDEIDEYPNLIRWTISNSTLENISGNFFISTPNLRTVDFKYNKIKHVGEGLLDNLEKLELAHFHENICIDSYAPTAAYIPALIEALRVQCSEINQETTTTILTTYEPTICEINDIEDFVCGLDEDIENLKIKNENLSNENQELRSVVEEHSQKLQEQAEKLAELEAIVIELSSRPCGC